MMRGGKHPSENGLRDGIGLELRPNITTLENGAVQATLFLRAKPLAVISTVL
jgi:hypothetical protein